MALARSLDEKDAAYETEAPEANMSVGDPTMVRAMLEVNKKAWPSCPTTRARHRLDGVYE
jgi:hypothetical protein